MRGHSQAVCDRIRKLREIHTIDAVAEIMHMNRRVVWCIERRGYVSRHGAPAKRPMPDDFALMRDKLSLHRLAKHYRTGLGCIYRWIDQAGGREYTPASSARKRPQRIRPAREAIEAAIAEHGVTRAADVLGVNTTTLQKWREFYGLKIHHKRAIELRKRSPLAGWADRYFDRKAA